MDYQLKHEDGLVCPFSGKPVDVLARVVRKVEGGKAEDSAWLSEEVLRRMLRMTEAVTEKTVVPPPVFTTNPCPYNPYPQPPFEVTCHTAAPIPVGKESLSSKLQYP